MAWLFSACTLILVRVCGYEERTGHLLTDHHIVFMRRMEEWFLLLRSVAQGFISRCQSPTMGILFWHLISFPDLWCCTPTSGFPTLCWHSLAHLWFSKSWSLLGSQLKRICCLHHCHFSYPSAWTRLKSQPGPRILSSLAWSTLLPLECQVCELWVRLLVSCFSQWPHV